MPQLNVVRIPFRKPPVLPRDSQRNSRAFWSGSAPGRCALFMHAISTCLMNGVKASIHDESTATIVVNEGHRNESEVPISGSVGANPLLDPHGPLALSPDSAEREALLALSPEVRPPTFLYLLILIHFYATHRHTQRTATSLSKALDVKRVLGSDPGNAPVENDRGHVSSTSTVCTYKLTCIGCLELSIRHLVIPNRFKLRSRTRRRKYLRSSLFLGPWKLPSTRPTLWIPR